MKKAICFFLFLGLCFVFSGCKTQEYVDRCDIIKVEITTNRSERPMLSEADIDLFITLYNEAEYLGKANGDGTTPDDQFIAYLKNGTMLIVSGFPRGPKYEANVTGIYDTVYIRSEGLEELASRVLREFYGQD